MIDEMPLIYKARIFFNEQIKSNGCLKVFIKYGTNNMLLTKSHWLVIYCELLVQNTKVISLQHIEGCIQDFQIIFMTRVLSNK